MAWQSMSVALVLLNLCGLMYVLNKSYLSFCMTRNHTKLYMKLKWLATQLGYIIVELLLFVLMCSLYQMHEVGGRCFTSPCHCRIKFVNVKPWLSQFHSTHSGTVLALLQVMIMRLYVYMVKWLWLFIFYVKHPLMSYRHIKEISTVNINYIVCIFSY
jgi:hypothetical protein